jgi:hypothetical protein
MTLAPDVPHVRFNGPIVHEEFPAYWRHQHRPTHVLHAAAIRTFTTRRGHGV